MFDLDDYHKEIQNVVNKHNSDCEGSLLEEHAHLVADLVNNGREEQMKKMEETIKESAKDSKFSKVVSIIAIIISVADFVWNNFLR